MPCSSSGGSAVIGASVTALTAQGRLIYLSLFYKSGAGEGIRTLDIQLGNTTSET
jgi:hypothetical protein